MTENPVDTANRRSITKPKTRAQIMKEKYEDIVNAEEEITYWTLKKKRIENEIEQINEKARTKSVQEGSGSKEGCKGFTDEEKS